MQTFSKYLMEAAILALAEDDESETIAADPEDANHDQKDPFDPELSRHKDGMIDGEVLVAGELLVRELLGPVELVLRRVTENHGHDHAGEAQPQPEGESKDEDLKPD